MKQIKNFNEFLLFEKNQNYINVYQNTINRFNKKFGIKLYYTLKYNTSIILLSKFIKTLMDYDIFDCENNIYNSVLLTVFGVSILTHELKNKTQKLYNFLIKNNIKDNDITKTINIFKNIHKILSDIYISIDNTVFTNFIDIIKNTDVLNNYLFVISDIINIDFIDVRLLSTEFDNFMLKIGDEEYRKLLNRIIHRMKISSENLNRFQNKNNIKPLLINNDLKSPLLKNKNYNI